MYKLNKKKKCTNTGDTDMCLRRLFRIRDADFKISNRTGWAVDGVIEGIRRKSNRIFRRGVS